MSGLCNDRSKETNAYQEFLNSNNVLVVTLPSMFLGIVTKYRNKKSEQSFRLYSDIQTLSNSKCDAVLIDNTMPCYYEFAKYVKRYLPNKVKFFVLVDNKYITDLKIPSTKRDDSSYSNCFKNKF